MKDYLKPSFPCSPYRHNPEILICWPENMGELAREEARHHDHDEEDPVEVHQLETWRNLFYHRLIWERLEKVPEGSRVLEIGAGSGFDARELADAYHLVLTDVSPDTLNRLSRRFTPKRTMDLIAVDGEQLPFKSGTFDAAYMIATFHHFHNTLRALSESARVIKPGGLLILGVEPNMTYFRPIKWFQGMLYRLSHTDPHHISQADAEMEGFSYSQLRLLFENAQWTQVNIRPMWFFAGFFHYGMEFVFRVFRLKKRMRLPLGFEKAVVWLDEVLFKIPGFKYLCWHWIVEGRKK